MVPRTKSCPRCGRDLPTSAYNYRDRVHRRLQSYCRDCSNAAWREWYREPRNNAHHRELVAARREKRRKRNREIVLRRKSEPCADCGQSFPPHVMDFDHLRDKTMEISRLVEGYATARLLAEIDKCEVVCANCHRQRTQDRL